MAAFAPQALPGRRTSLMKAPDFPHLHAIAPPMALPRKPDAAARTAQTDSAPVGRSQVWLLALSAGLMAAGAAAILLFDGWRDDDLAAIIEQADPAGSRVTVAEVMPGARLSTGAAATGPESGAVARQPLHVLPPADPLDEVGSNLSSEWRLALAPASFARAPVSAPPPPAALVEAAPMPLTAAAFAEGASPTLHPNISMRVYPQPQGPTLGEQLAACDTRGLFARHACRTQVCAPHLGVAAECPAPPPVILP